MLLLRLPSLSAMRPQVLRDWRAKAQTMSQIEDPRRIVVEARRGRSRAIARDKALREMRFLTSYFFFFFFLWSESSATRKDDGTRIRGIVSRRKLGKETIRLLASLSLDGLLSRMRNLIESCYKKRLCKAVISQQCRKL
jgi:hypothetical protein